MTATSNNPFVLPGLGQGGELGQNPLLASLEMMRQAWQGLASSALPGLGPSAAAVPMSLEELDRRISELRAVENWLRMNLTMLSSSIQALEVQRATIATLKSFMASPPSAAAATSAAAPAPAAEKEPSPLDVALGIKHAHAPSAADAPSDKPRAEAGAEAKSVPHSITQDWWNMLQKQFDTLAAATAATMQGAEAVRAAGSPKSGPAHGSGVKSAPSKKKAAPRKAAGKRAQSTAAKKPQR
jgi:hypothetical protein